MALLLGGCGADDSVCPASVAATIPPPSAGQGQERSFGLAKLAPPHRALAWQGVLDDIDGDTDAVWVVDENGAVAEVPELTPAPCGTCSFAFSGAVGNTSGSIAVLWRVRVNGDASPQLTVVVRDATGMSAMWEAPFDPSEWFSGGQVAWRNDTAYVAWVTSKKITDIFLDVHLVRLDTSATPREPPVMIAEDLPPAKQGGLFLVPGGDDGSPGYLVMALERGGGIEQRAIESGPGLTLGAPEPRGIAGDRLLRARAAEAGPPEVVVCRDEVVTLERTGERDVSTVISCGDFLGFGGSGSVRWIVWNERVAEERRLRVTVIEPETEPTLLDCTATLPPDQPVRPILHEDVPSLWWMGPRDEDGVSAVHELRLPPPP